MRPRLSKRLVLLAGALAASALVPASPLAAQSEVADEGALFLLLPVGARSAGMGQAIVAQRGGSEAVWWNPSALATSTKTEAAIHHSQSIVGTGDAVTLIIPSSLLGVLAVSADVVSFGEQEVTQDQVSLGTLLPRSFVFAASYATPIGSSFGVGISYKVLQFRVDCTGPCPNVANFSATSSALDAGLQYAVNSKRFPVVFGIAVRNLGVRLQVNDNPQSDPLPTRVQAGAQYLYHFPTSIAPDAEARLEVDVLDDGSLSRPAARMGAEFGWQKRAFVRAGYVFEDSEGGGPSIGLGLVFGGFSLDLGRIVSGLSADAGQAPTFLSLRYLF